MGVYIKGIEMPKDCFGCPMVSGYEIADEVRTRCSTVRCRLTNTKRPVGEAISPDCPLVSVPEHGRLGDLDELAERLEDLRKTTAKENQPTDIHGFNNGIMCGIGAAINEVRYYAPIIIPADKEGET